MGETSYNCFTNNILVVLFSFCFWKYSVANIHKELRLCTFHGTVADPSDCSAYYHCAEGKLYHYNCGSQSAFDPTLHTCVSPPTQVTCPNGQKFRDKPEENDPFICIEDGYFRNPNDCTRFYRCSKHSKHAFSCPLGMAFNSEKITCDPIDSVVDCNSGTTHFYGTTFEPREYEAQKQAANSEFDRLQSHGDVASENRLNKEIPGINPNNIAQGHAKSLPKGIGDRNSNKPVKNKGDLFYLWNFDGQTGFDDYISLEEAANMQYKMPDSDNSESINANRYNSLSDSDMLIDFADQPSRSILQNSSPPKPFTQIEPKIGSEAIAGYHVWDHQKNAFYQDQKQPGFPLTDSSYYGTDFNEPPPHGFYDNQYINMYDQYLDKPRANNNHAMPDKMIDRSFDTDSGISIDIQYNSPGNFESVRKAKEKKSAPMKKQSPPHPNQSSGMGHYGSIKPLARPHRKPSPKFVPFNGRDPFHCPHDGYFRDEDDCSRFYHCTHGLPYMVKCNGGLYFNPVNKICDWPARVPGCSDRMRKVFVRPPRLNDPESRAYISDGAVHTTEAPKSDSSSNISNSDGPIVDDAKELKPETMHNARNVRSNSTETPLSHSDDSTSNPLKESNTDTATIHHIHGIAQPEVPNHPMNSSGNNHKLNETDQTNGRLNGSLQEHSTYDGQSIFNQVKRQEFDRYKRMNASGPAKKSNLSKMQKPGSALNDNVQEGNKTVKNAEDGKLQSIVKNNNEENIKINYEDVPLGTYLNKHGIGQKGQSIKHEKSPTGRKVNLTQRGGSPTNMAESHEELDTSSNPDNSASRLIMKDPAVNPTVKDPKPFLSTPGGSVANPQTHEMSAVLTYPKHIPVLVKDNDCVEIGFHRHPTDCSIFYRCTSKAKIEYKCEADMAYQTQIKACLPRGMVHGCDKH